MNVGCDDGDKPTPDATAGTDAADTGTDAAGETDTPQVCNKTLQKVCDPSDPENLYFADSCGGFHSVSSDCNFGRVCTDDDGPGGSDASCQDPFVPCDGAEVDGDNDGVPDGLEVFCGGTDPGDGSLPSTEDKRRGQAPQSELHKTKPTVS